MPIGSGTNYFTTLSMGLTQPIPGQCGPLGVEPTGRSWLELINSSLGTIDGHNHTAGLGVPIPTSGLNINSDLPFGGFSATTLRSTRYTPIALASLLAADVGCLIVSGVDLYYVDRNGSQIRLTSAGGIAGTPGSISGLASPAAVSYTVASKLFSFTSSSGFVANMSCGPLSIGDATASGGFAATLQVPAGIASNYTMTLPGALPGALSFLTLSPAGAIASGPSISGGLTTAHLSGSAGILGSQLSAGAAILGSQLAANTVARGQLAAVGQQISASCGNFTSAVNALVDVTNLTVTITTTGRPVMVVLQTDGAAGGTTITQINGGGNLQLFRGATNLAIWFTTVSNPIQFGPNGFTFVDPVAAGTYTYKISANPGGSAFTMAYFRLAVYEL